MAYRVDGPPSGQPKPNPHFIAVAARTANQDRRQVHLPLDNDRKCHQCQKQGEVRLSMCSRCGEAVYCNSKCQTAHWPVHKAFCGKTDRVDLASFYPLIAVIMDEHRYSSVDRPKHPALTHKVVSIAKADSSGLYGASSPPPMLLILGEKIDDLTHALVKEKVDTDAVHMFQTAENAKQKEWARKRCMEWWPVRLPDGRAYDRLVKRFTAEHLILPSVVAAAVLLMSEVYVTTYIPAQESSDEQEKRRVRFKYRNSPVTDFGIVKGRVELTGQCERYSYYSSAENFYTTGQESNEHYWMYFTTILGHECILDCGRLPFGAWETVDNEVYAHNTIPFPSGGASPAYFQDCDNEYDTPLRYHETRRFSVLKDSSLHDITRHSLDDPTEEDTEAISTFMDKVAGRQCSKLEKKLAVSWFRHSKHGVQMCVASRYYRKFPAKPTVFGERSEGFPKGPSRQGFDEEIMFMKYAEELADNLDRTFPDTLAGID